MLHKSRSQTTSLFTDTRSLIKVHQGAAPPTLSARLRSIARCVRHRTGKALPKGGDRAALGLGLPEQAIPIGSRR